MTWTAAGGFTQLLTALAAFAAGCVYTAWRRRAAHAVAHGEADAPPPDGASQPAPADAGDALAPATVADGPETGGAAAVPCAAIRDLLAAATEQADELITIVASGGAMAHANGAFCRALGYDLATLRAMRAADCLGEQSRATLEEIEAAVRADGVWRGTLVRRRADASTFLSSCSVMTLSGDAGASFFVAVERDVTGETQLREQLIHSERLAAVGQLVSGVAHELNNPLQSIIGFTELLIEAERRKESRADLEQVRTEAHRAAKIVRNLLAFVRRSAVERSQASLNDLVQSTVALRKYEFAMSGIELAEEYAEHLPPVMVNREEIQQVLLNLLLNSEQAMRATGAPGRIALRTWLGPEGVTIELQDNGPGVPVALARRIFEPFYSTKGVGEGTGLGLSIALGIAEAHGGSLALVPGNTGACFRLTLPPAAGMAEIAPESPVPDLSWAAVPGRRALVADDERPLRMLLQRLLTRRGFAVDMAEDGLQAASLIDCNRYDVILCDVQMPKLTGTQLYESVRRRQPHVASAFVLISGDILNGPLQSFVASAQIPLLSKPFGARTLDVALEEVLAHRVQSRETIEARAS